MNDDEKLWITRARQGDDQAFAQLVEAYQRPVFNLCYRMLGDPAEAEDAAQETFIRAYTRLDSYDPARKFSSWLLAVASHYCIDRLRRRHFGLVSWDDLPPWRWLPDPDPQPEEVTLRHEAQRHVQELLDRLPADYRAAVVLRYWHDLSYEEIAQALGSTLPAIKSRLFRARQMLAEAAAQADTIATANKPAFTNHADALQGARPLHG
jgi:RNA polymerase sigma-70 factor (ECF subfamily)